MKSRPTTEEPLCRICLKPLRTKPVRLLLEGEPLFCDACLEQMEFDFKIRRFDGIHILFAYPYAGFFKDLLLQYKERFDVALAPVFLYFIRPLVRTLLRKHVFVPVPSTRKKEEERGFSHLEEMLKAWNIPYCQFLEKIGEEQKEKAFLERFNAKTIRKAKDAVSIENKRIVLFDDVFTTGETFRQSLEILKAEKAKGIVGLVLMDNHFNRDLRRKS